MRKPSVSVIPAIAFAIAISLYVMAIANALQSPSIFTVGMAWRAIAVCVTLLVFLLTVAVGDKLRKRPNQPIEFPGANVRSGERIDRAA